VDRHLVLHHGGSLSAQYFDRLKHVDNTFVPHPLQDDAQRHEHPRTTNARTTQRQLSIIIIIIISSTAAAAAAATTVCCMENQSFWSETAVL